MGSTITEKPGLDILTGDIVTSEWNHSCTPQCPPNCEAAKNALLVPQTDDTQAPTAA